MSNPNPSAPTRFQPGNPGGPGRRKKLGDRDRLTAKFLHELAESFEEHGRTAIQAVMLMDTPKYLQIVAALVPKQVEIGTRPEDALNDGELAEAILTLAEAIRTQQAPPAPEPDEAPKVLQ